jgi:hypothetical protein
MEGLLAAFETIDSEQITCCIDSQSVIWGLAGTALTSSQKAFLQWQEAADQAPVKVSIKWSPGHIGIRGNERADQLCSSELTWNLVAPETPPTYARVRARMAERQRDRASEWHRSHRPTNYLVEVWQALGFGPRKTRDLRIPRDMLSRLVQSRTAHGDFPEYHEKYFHQEYAPKCGCGQPKRPEHIVFCRKVR